MIPGRLPGHRDFADRDCVVRDRRNRGLACSNTQPLQIAQAADKLAFKQAAVAGEPDLGLTATETARRALAYQEERVNAAAREVNKEAAALNRIFHEHREELIDEACVQAEETKEEFRRGVASIYAQSREVTAQRNRGLAPLRWVAGLMDGSMRYDPSFPMSGDFQMTNTTELKVSGIVTLLRRFMKRLDKDGEAAYLRFCLNMGSPDLGFKELCHVDSHSRYRYPFWWLSPRLEFVLRGQIV